MEICRLLNICIRLYPFSNVKPLIMQNFGNLPRLFDMILLCTMGSNYSKKAIPLTHKLINS